MCIPTDSTEKHSSFALSPSSHSARQDFKGDDDDGVDEDDHNEHSHIHILVGLSMDPLLKSNCLISIFIII